MRLITFLCQLGMQHATSEVQIRRWRLQRVSFPIQWPQSSEEIISPETKCIDPDILGESCVWRYFWASSTCRQQVSSFITSRSNDIFWCHSASSLLTKGCVALLLNSRTIWALGKMGKNDPELLCYRGFNFEEPERSSQTLERGLILLHELLALLIQLHHTLVCRTLSLYLYVQSVLLSLSFLTTTRQFILPSEIFRGSETAKNLKPTLMLHWH